MLQARVKRELFNRLLNSYSIGYWCWLAGRGPWWVTVVRGSMRTEKGAQESTSHQKVDLRLEQTNSRRHPGVGATSPCLLSLQKDTTLDPLFQEERERETQRAWFPASSTGFCSFRTKGKEGECFKLSPYVTKVAPIDMWMLVLWKIFWMLLCVFWDKSAKI